jgi:hypothetical protein
LKYLIVFSLTGLLALPHTVFAQTDPRPCHEIVDPTERLACYDKASQQERTTPDAPAPALSSEPVPANAIDKPTAPKSRGLFSASENLVINSKLTSIRDRDKQKMVFRLENEQIWLQDSPRSLPFREGDDVTIKSATIGGYILSNNKGVSTRVRRIK